MTPDAGLAAPVAPLYDTWQVQSASMWTIEPRVPALHEASELNAWCTRAAAESLGSLGPWLRPVKIMAYAPATPTQAELRIEDEWRSDVSPERFVHDALDRIGRVPGALYGLELELDLLVWFRAPGPAPRPARAWLRAPTALRIGGSAPRSRSGLRHARCQPQRVRRLDLAASRQRGIARAEPAAARSGASSLGGPRRTDHRDGVDVFRYGFRRPAR